MARLPLFFSNLCIRWNPKFLKGAGRQIQSRNSGVDQFDGNSEELVANPQIPDEIFAQNRSLSLSAENGSSEGLMEKPGNLDEKFVQTQIQNVSEIAKEVSNLIRTRPRWEQMLLTDFPTVNFRDPTVYNEVLKQLSNVFLSLRFYFWLRSLNWYKFDPVLCNLIFSRLVGANAAHAAKSFLDDTKFEPDPWYSELYIRCLCQNGLIDQALDVFERLKMIGHCVSLETWNLALSHSMKTKGVDVVWKLYEDMIGHGVKADVNTIGHLIQAFCLENNVEKAYELLHKVLQAGHIPDKIVFNKLISALCKNHNYGKVSAVLHRMIAKNCSPDVYCYQEVINRLCKGRIRMRDEGFRIFNELKDRGYFPDRVMYTTMIHGLCKNKDIGDARKLWFEMIRNGMIPNKYTYNAFIDGLWRSGCIDEAQKLHKEMLDEGYPETTISYNTMINGLCMNGKVEEARVLFDEMTEKGIVRDSITYNSLIQGFSKQGKVTEGMYFFNELLKQGFRPSNASLSVLIKKLCESDRVKEAEILWVDMHDKGLEPAVRFLDPIIVRLSEQGHYAEAIEWLEYMINNGGRPKKTTFEKLIESHFTDDRFDDALFVLGSMLKMGFVLSESICHSLVDKLCPDSSHHMETSLGEILGRI